MTKSSTPSRFGSPKVLRQDTLVLGATVADWDAAFTGNMHKSLEEVKRAVSSATAKLDPSAATSFDVASLARRHLAPR